jgi:hypothetical protein
MYDLADTVPIGAEFRDAAGALVNPSTITLTITLPDATTVAPTPTNVSTGIYTYQYVTTQAGRHLVRWVTTTPATAHTDSFDVAAADPGLIMSLAEVKDYLQKEALVVDDDDKLRSFIAALTPVVEKYCGAVVRRIRTSIVRPYCTGEPIALPFSPVISLTSAALLRDGSALVTTGWYTDGPMLYPGVSGYFPLEPFTLTYVVGRPDLPDNIRLGALYVLKLAWRSQRGNNPDTFMGFLVANAAAEWFAGDRQLLGFG